MKYIICCLVLVLCITEASTIKSILSTKQNSKLKFSLDDLTNEDAPSPYAYLEGKTESSLEEPRFLAKKQFPAPSIDPSSQIASLTPDMMNAQATTTPVFVASSPPGMQLTRIPYVGPADPILTNDILLEEDPEMAKLGAALEAVKEDLVGNSKQISDERKWVGAVKAITQSYDDKMKRVHDHITALRLEQKKLFEKKTNRKFEIAKTVAIQIDSGRGGIEDLAKFIGSCSAEIARSQLRTCQLANHHPED